MGNPLAEYVTMPPPSFDYTDARTWYDGLWGGGQWPPEGFPGHPAIHGLSGLDQNLAIWNQPAAWMPGDRARLATGWGIRGLGTTPSVTCDANGNCVDENGNAVDAEGNPIGGGAAPSAGSPPCMFSSTPVQLLPGQVYCRTGTTTPPTSNQQTPAQQQGTIIMITAAGVLVLLVLAMRR